MNWMFLPLKRYADFQGRSRRLEYWMFALFQAVIWGVFFALYFNFAASTGVMMEPGQYGDDRQAAAAAAMMSGPFATVFMVFSVIWLALLIPSLAVVVRRFHDQDKTGWLVLLALIPLVGGLILLVFMLLPGTPGSNTYGPDPKEGEV